jgi:hypothetical protein
MKRKEKKRLRDQPEDKQVKIQQSNHENPSVEEKPFDFGGLPDRDFKKNLGCG